MSNLEKCHHGGRLCLIAIDRGEQDQQQRRMGRRRRKIGRFSHRKRYTSYKGDNHNHKLSEPKKTKTKMHLLQSPASLYFSRSPLSLFPSSPLKTNFSPKTLNPRTKRQHLSVACRSSNYFDQQRYSASPPPAQSPQPPAGSASRVFVGYSIYKGKAALTVEPRAPEFAPLDSGAFKVSKEGFLLLQFAPAVAVRQYDWNRKQVFSLSVAEIGTLMSLGAKDACEFFHDPFKGRGEEGKIRKLLKVEPLPDGTGHFFNLSVQNRLLNVDESIYIPISKAEFAVLNSTFNFILPHLLGWQAFANTIKPEDSMRSNNATSGSGAELEWGR